MTFLEIGLILQFKSDKICQVKPSDIFSELEKYRSGHNERDSKSYGELSVSSIKNLVAMRVLPGSKIE